MLMLTILTTPGWFKLLTVAVCQCFMNLNQLLRSRDDYVCTDEEIELLNKFPRQSLKLETYV